MDIKLIASDLDGTLINSKNQLTDRTIKAIKSAISLGIDFIPCTGRTLSSIDSKLMNISGIRYVIASNGAVIFDTVMNKQIYSDTIDLLTCVHILKIVSEYDICPIVFFDHKAFVPKYCYNAPLKYGLLEPMLEYFNSTRSPVDDILELVIKRNKPIDKIFLMMNNQNIKNDLQNIFCKYSDICVTSSALNNIEIVNKTATKANALKFLLKKLDSTSDNLMAFGDSPNDDNMLSLAKYSFAVDNASDYIKNIAKYYTLSNDDNGVAYAIEKYIIKNRQ